MGWVALTIMLNILHLTFDYPDALRANTTMAIKRLVDCADTFANNYCISLHNNFPRRPRAVEGDGRHAVVAPSGLMLGPGFLRFLNKCVLEIQGRKIPWTAANVIHGHKLVMEGYIARELSRILNIPYCVSVRATDFSILICRPRLKAVAMDILTDAAKIAIVSPWMLPKLRQCFGTRWSDALERKIVLLGNVADGPILFREADNGRFVMPLSLNRSQLERKNVLRTLQAVAATRRMDQRVFLDIIGDGSGMKRVRGWVDRLGLKEHVALIGAVPHEKMIGRLAGYKALILCSNPETFGLVYVEGLRGGIPLIFSRGCGFDGFLEGYNFGLGVPDGSVDCIGQAICTMMADHRRFKCSIKRLQEANELDFFSRTAVAERLRDMYRCASGTSAESHHAPDAQQ